MCRYTIVRWQRLILTTLFVAAVVLGGATSVSSRPAGADPTPTDPTTAPPATTPANTAPPASNAPPASTAPPVTAAPPVIPPPPPPPPSASPPILATIALLSQKVHGAEQRLDAEQSLQQQLQQTVDTLSVQIGALDGKIADLVSQIHDNEAAIADQHATLDEVVISQYQNQGTASRIQGSDSTADRIRKEKYSSALTDHQIKVVAELRSHHGDLRQAEDDTRAERGRLDGQREQANASLADAGRMVAEGDREASDARFVLARWNTISRAAATPIMDVSALSADELARWFVSTGRHARTTVPIAELARLYIDEGRAEGVRGDIAFAQAILETGSFNLPGSGKVAESDNNFAGIGACDSCARGYSFPDARTGVQAQIQLLRSYSDRTVTSATLANPPRLANFDRGSHGFAPTWGDLSHRWATGAGYGDSILLVYVEILRFATNVR